MHRLAARIPVPGSERDACRRALSAADGALISQTSASGESFAGRDVVGTALAVINERADEVVAQLYNVQVGVLRNLS